MRWLPSIHRRRPIEPRPFVLRSRALLRSGTVQIEVATGRQFVLERVRGQYVDVTGMYDTATIGLPLPLSTWLGPEFRELTPVSSLRTRRGDHHYLEVVR